MSAAHLWVNDAQATDANPVPIAGTANLHVSSAPVTESNPLYAEKPVVRYDALGRMRTSESQTLFDGSFVTSSNTGRWSDYTVTGGTVDARPSGESYVSLEVDTQSGARALRQSRRYVSYQPGKSMTVIITGVLAESVPFTGATVTRIGYFDDTDGAAFQYGANGLRVLFRAYGSDTVATPDDPLDGTGASGIALDPTKRNIYWIEFKWLGAGDVALGVFNGNVPVRIHTFENNNTGSNQLTYWTRGSLPVRWEAFNDGGIGSGGAVRAFCCQVSSEGGYNPRGLERSDVRSQPWSVSSGTETWVHAIRLRSTARRVTVNLHSIGKMLTSSGIYMIFRVYRYPGPATGTALNPAASGSDRETEWVPVTDAVEVYEYGANGLTTPSAITDRELVATMFASADDRVVDRNVQLLLTSDYSGLSDIFALTVQRVAGSGTDTGYTSMHWQELD